MKLEVIVGKSYINGFGDIVDIVEDDGQMEWPIEGINRNTKNRLIYQRDGRWTISRSKEDLIKEHIDNERTT